MSEPAYPNAAWLQEPPARKTTGPDGRTPLAPATPAGGERIPRVGVGSEPAVTCGPRGVQARGQAPPRRGRQPNSPKVLQQGADPPVKGSPGLPRVFPPLRSSPGRWAGVHSWPDAFPPRRTARATSPSPDGPPPRPPRLLDRLRRACRARAFSSRTEGRPRRDTSPSAGPRAVPALALRAGVGAGRVTPPVLQGRGPAVAVPRRRRPWPFPTRR
jgi:hypothetical protein